MDRQLVSALTLLVEKLDHLVASEDVVESQTKTPQFFVGVAQTFFEACTRDDIETMKSLHTQYNIKIISHAIDLGENVTLTGFPGAKLPEGLRPGWSYTFDVKFSSFMQDVNPKTLTFLYQNCNLKRELIRLFTRKLLKSPLQDDSSVALCHWFTPQELIADVGVIESGNIMLFCHLWNNGTFQEFDNLCACLRDVVSHDHLHIFEHIYHNLDATTLTHALGEIDMGKYNCVNILKYLLSKILVTTSLARSILFSSARHGRCGVLVCLKQYFGLSKNDLVSALHLATENGQAIGVQTLLCTFNLTLHEDEYRKIKNLAVQGDHWDVVSVLVACSVNCLI